MTRTIDVIKEKRTVSEEVKCRVKEFNKEKKAILNSLKDGPKSIPQISEDTGLLEEKVTFVLMTLRKFKEVETGEIDDMDEYFTYKLSKQD